MSSPLGFGTSLTPARAKGFKAHYDTHDVFVLQVVGSKQWTLYGTPVENTQFWCSLSGVDRNDQIDGQEKLCV